MSQHDIVIGLRRYRLFGVLRSHIKVEGLLDFVGGGRDTKWMDELLSWECVVEALCFRALFLSQNVCVALLVLSICGLLLLFLEHALV